MRYIKQLDSLRAIAVLFVMVSHWLPKTHFMNRYTPNGSIGVDIFFVLSGFLISKILFDGRDKAAAGTLSIPTVLKHFYARRSLRIFPIYYLTIFILLLIPSYIGSNITAAFPYLVTYTSNCYFFNLKEWDGPISHLWSLAVEEQFYLLWPFVLLFTRQKYLLPIIMSFILIGPVSTFLLRDYPLSNVLTFTCFDAFGLGTLLSWQVTYGRMSMKKFHTIMSWVAGLCAVLFAWSMITSPHRFFLLRTIISIMALWLITYIVRNAGSTKKLFTLLWNNRILLFLGKISYGLYLFHNFVPLITTKLINVYFNPLLPDLLYKRFWGELIFFENMVLVILISWFSFVFIEKKFLSLKKYFEYKKVVREVSPVYDDNLAMENQPVSAADSRSDEESRQYQHQL